MGYTSAFSSIRKVIDETQAHETGCLVDTNFLVALTYEPHAFHEDAVAAFEVLAEREVPLYVGLSSRSELLDFQRRVVITEALMDMLTEGARWRISSEVRKVLRVQKNWIDIQASTDNLPILMDARIKTCKEVFLPKTQSGKVGWLEICREYLSDLTSAWSSVEKDLGIRYVGVREAEETDLFAKKLKWENLYRLSAKTCLGSQDAMLLNLFDSSIFPMLLSTDYDLAYGVLAEANEKVVLVPDSLYERKVKKLRFPAAG